MQAFHSTSLATYRRPFGAVREGEQVTLSIAVWGDDVTSCILRLWIDGDAGIGCRLGLDVERWKKW